MFWLLEDETTAAVAAPSRRDERTRLKTFMLDDLYSLDLRFINVDSGSMTIARFELSMMGSSIGKRSHI